MTATAIILLVATAVVAVIPAIVRLRLLDDARHPRAATALDGTTAATMIVLAAAAAVIAASAGPARDAGEVVTVCASMIAATAGGGFVVRLVLRAGGVNPHDDGPDRGPLRGGRVIGYLERGAVAATLLAGWPDGLVVILAVKSFARYPELRAPQASEQFIMGTFASVLWAAGMAGVAYLIGH